MPICGYYSVTTNSLFPTEITDMTNRYGQVTWWVTSEGGEGVKVACGEACDQVPRLTSNQCLRCEVKASRGRLPTAKMLGRASKGDKWIVHVAFYPTIFTLPWAHPASIIQVPQAWSTSKYKHKEMSLVLRTNRGPNIYFICDDLPKYGL